MVVPAPCAAGLEYPVAAGLELPGTGEVDWPLGSRVVEDHTGGVEFAVCDRGSEVAPLVGCAACFCSDG